MRNLIVTIVLTLSSFALFAQSSNNVPFVGVITPPTDTIRTTVIFEGDADIDIIKLVEQDKTIVKLFNYYSDVQWKCWVDYDGSAVVNNKGMKRVRIIKVVAVCSQPMNTTIK